ncbi:MULTISPECIES: TonB-dependent receptor [Flavobacteriaceae]|uniref:TonB-dependent receptor n=1 Tax=Flavobacteriaceae TaxID=49546 RepID=UPI00234B35AA|nr:TonB-dependent receptor [Muricauda sp. SP22]MDC6362497.1 TonB-dependent receptor [Muricauda sp. SP22]
MLGTLRNSQFCLLLGFLLFFLTLPAQEKQQTPVDLISYIKTLENRFNIKFSYLNEDLDDFKLSVPENRVSLEDILNYIESKFQIKAEKLDERYYTLTKSSHISLCGTVLDNFAENTIPGASIEVLGTKIAQTTDTNGNFSMNNIPRDASLKIRYLGYLTKYIPIEDLIRQESCAKILMAPHYEQLDEVIVYKYLTTGILKEQDGSITLNTAEFGILPGLIEPDVLQTVQALPGIKSIDETVSDINVRGGTNDQNLVLWNGIKMYQFGHFFGLISAFNPYLTDKVSVIKNGTPAAFGDGVSSVIQMETSNQIVDTFEGGAGFNFISGDIFGQFPLSNKLGFQFSARRSTTDFLNTPTYNKFFDRAFQDSKVTDENNVTVDENISRDEDFYFYDFSGKLLYDINDFHKLRFSAIHINNNLNYIETDQTNDETTQSILEQTNISIGGQLLSDWSGNFSSQLNVYYSRYNLDAQSIFDNQIQQLEQKNIVDERAVKVNTEYKFTDHLQWTNGFQYIETGVENFTDVNVPDFHSKVIDVIRIRSLYSEARHTSFRNKFICMLGVRFNFIENLGTFNKYLVEPRINLNFKLANYLRAELLGEFKSQTTHQIIDLEQNFLGIEKRRWTLSDDDTLPITHSKQGSLGINYERNNFYLGLEGFYKNVDGISTRTQGFQNQNQFSGEIGSYDVKGVEFLINKRGDNYSTWLSYAYNKNDYTFNSVVPSKFPNNLDIHHTITFAGTYNYKDLKLSLGINYRTGKPYTEPLEGDQALDNSFFPARINYQSPNSSRLPEYFRADASAVYSFDMGRRIRATTGVSLLNMTNRKNSLNRYYRVNDEDQIEAVESISLGITPNMSFRISF